MDHTLAAFLGKAADDVAAMSADDRKAAVATAWTARSSSDADAVAAVSDDDLVAHAELHQWLIASGAAADDLAKVSLPDQMAKAQQKLVADKAAADDVVKGLAVVELSTLALYPALYAVGVAQANVAAKAAEVDRLAAMKVKAEEEATAAKTEEPAATEAAAPADGDAQPADGDAQPADETKPADEPADEATPAATEEAKTDDAPAKTVPPTEEEISTAAAAFDDAFATYKAALETAQKAAADEDTPAAEEKKEDPATTEAPKEDGEEEKKEDEPAQDAEPAAAPAEEKSEIEKLEQELKDVTAEKDGAATVKIAEMPVAAYGAYLDSRAHVHGHLDMLAGSHDGYCDQDSRPNETVTARAEDWDAVVEALGKKVDELEADGGALVGDAAALVPEATLKVDDVKELLTKVQGQKDSLLEKVEGEKTRKTAFDDNYKEFDQERRRMLLWCRQQKTNLDSMVEVDDVQEFCASLLNNFGMMQENFSVLLDLAEGLLPSPLVQNALVEANEVWLNLQISAYDRLRHTLLEIHQKSKLEDEVRAFAAYSQQARDFLEDFKQLLSAPTDSESLSLVQPVVEECGRLVADYDQHHSGLATQLSEFSMRMEGLRDNYGNLRRAVFSHLTFLAQTVPTLSASVHRKDEYLQKMTDLKKWVQVKGQGESWGDVRGRVDKIRVMIEEEQKALDEETKAADAEQR
jgi:hypothetical protein